MRQIKGPPEPTPDEVTEALQSLWMGLGSRPMVQVLCLTIDGQKVVCLGPVLHVPPMGLHVGDIQEIEFCEILPAQLAARLLDSDMTPTDDLH